MAEKITKVLARGLVVWLVIMFAESVHGTLRELFLKPLVGDLRARQISFFIALAIILTITFFFIRWIRASNTFQLLATGGMWVVLTLCFEMLIVRPVMNISWERALADYNFFAGGLMFFGLIVLFFAPLIAMWARNLVSLSQNDVAFITKRVKRDGR